MPATNVILKWLEASKNTLVKTPQWLQGALGLQDATVPRTLYLDNILPVAEVVQGGWPGAASRIGSGVVDGAVTVTFEQGDPAFQFLILAAAAVKSAGLANDTYSSLWAINLGVTDGIRLATPNLSGAAGTFPNGFKSSADLLPGGPVLLPPGMGFLAQMELAFTAGDEVTWSVLYAKLPAGAKAL